MGLETEFGILGESPGENPMLMSALVVTAYARHALPEGTAPRWDYGDEDPLNDARGWRLDRRAADPSQLTDDPARPAGGGAAQGPAAPPPAGRAGSSVSRSEEHTSELQSRGHIVCRLLLEKQNIKAR